MPPVYIYIFRPSGYPHIYIVPRNTNPEHPCTSAQSQILFPERIVPGAWHRTFHEFTMGRVIMHALILSRMGVIHYLLAWPWIRQTNQESLRQRTRDPPAPKLSSGIQILGTHQNRWGQVMSGTRCLNLPTRIYVSSSRNSLVTCTPPFRQNNKTPFPGRKTKHIQA